MKPGMPHAHMVIRVQLQDYPNIIEYYIHYQRNKQIFYKTSLTAGSCFGLTPMHKTAWAFNLLQNLFRGSSWNISMIYKYHYRIL